MSSLAKAILLSSDCFNLANLAEALSLLKVVAVMDDISGKLSGILFSFWANNRNKMVDTAVDCLLDECTYSLTLIGFSNYIISYHINIKTPAYKGQFQMSQSMYAWCSLQRDTTFDCIPQMMKTSVIYSSDLVCQDQNFALQVQKFFTGQWKKSYMCSIQVPNLPQLCKWSSS